MAQGRFEEAAKRLQQLNQQTQEMMAAMQNQFEASGTSRVCAAAISELDQALDRLVDEQSGLIMRPRRSISSSGKRVSKALDEARRVAKKVDDAFNRPRRRRFMHQTERNWRHVDGKRRP